MKIATLTDNYNQTHKDVFYLENLEDLYEFEKLSNNVNDDEITLALKTDIPESKWDHLFDGSLGGMNTAVATSNIVGGNLILLSASILNKKLDSIRKYISDGVPVVINKRGGYFPCIESMDIKILDIKEYIHDKRKYVNIPNNTKTINLENDLHLEKLAISYMKSIDPNYSSITKLREFDFLELVEIFKVFIKNGGQTAYIYTTGIDTEQMYEYTNALIVAGVQNVHFEFNSGINNKIQLFLDTIQFCDINVTVKKD